MNELRNFANNPQNPKNIQISFIVFLAVEMLLAKINENQLTDDEILTLKFACKEIKNKKSKILNRQTFTAIVQAQTEDEKQAAYENYRLTKEFTRKSNAKG